MELVRRLGIARITGQSSGKIMRWCVRTVIMIFSISAEVDYHTAEGKGCHQKILVLINLH